MNPPATRRAGLTLLELLIVVVLLALLAMLVVPMIGTTVTSSELDATYQTMQALRDAIMGTATIAGYFPDMKGLTGIADGRDNDGMPRLISDLLTNPQTVVGPPAAYFFPTFDPQVRKGWRGPYLSQTKASGAAILDSFPQAGISGSAILLEWPTTDPAFVRLRSRGPDGQLVNLTGKFDPRIGNITAADCGDDVILYVRRDLPGMDWTNYWELKKTLQGNH